MVLPRSFGQFRRRSKRRQTSRMVVIIVCIGLLSLLTYQLLAPLRVSMLSQRARSSDPVVVQQALTSLLGMGKPGIKAFSQALTMDEDDIVYQLSAPKQIYALGERVTLACTLENRTSRHIWIEKPDPANMGWAISVEYLDLENQSTSFALRPPWKRIVSLASLRHIDPEKSISVERSLAELLREAPTPEILAPAAQEAYDLLTERSSESQKQPMRITITSSYSNAAPELLKRQRGRAIPKSTTAHWDKQPLTDVSQIYILPRIVEGSAGPVSGGIKASLSVDRTSCMRGARITATFSATNAGDTNIRFPHFDHKKNLWLIIRNEAANIVELVRLSHLREDILESITRLPSALPLPLPFPKDQNLKPGKQMSAQSDLDMNLPPGRYALTAVFAHPANRTGDTSTWSGKAYSNTVWIEVTAPARF